MPNYILNGEVVEVAPEHVEIFKAQNPSSKMDSNSNAQVAKDILPTPGKLTSPASKNTDSGSGDGCSVVTRELNTLQPSKCRRVFLGYKLRVILLKK